MAKEEKSTRNTGQEKEAEEVRERNCKELASCIMQKKKVNVRTR